MAEKLFKFENGVAVKDVVTGFAGTIMGRTDYLTGCKQYGVLERSLTKEGSPREWLWFDESRLELSDQSTVKIDEEADPGGPAPSAPEC